MLQSFTAQGITASSEPPGVIVVGVAGGMNVPEEDKGKGNDV